MTVLLLAGSSEARALAERLQGRDVIASLAGATRTPAPLLVETRIGGFGGPDGLRDYCRNHKIKAIVDATHPFATQITQSAVQVSNDLGLPFLILQRSGWIASPQDRWAMISDIAQTAEIIPEGSTVFIGTGRQTLQEYKLLANRRLLARVIDQPVQDFPFKNGRYLVGKPPFSVEEEIELFETEGVDWLVVKNSGGDASRSKLDAAAKLGLPVAMIKRPVLADAEIVVSVDGALHWLDARGLCD